MVRFWILVVVCYAGCGPSNIGQVTGRVTLDGKPLPVAMLEFQPATGAPSYAETDRDGNYVAMYRVDQQGALVGEHTVRITTAGEVTNEQGDTVNVREQVPPWYNMHSQLKIQVERGHNAHDFELSTSRPE